MNTELSKSTDHSPSIQPFPSKSDRREAYRTQFDAQALVAYCAGDELPSPDDFQLVECQDLSGTGFSFCWPVQPFSQRLVVILRKCNGYISLSAQVMNCRPLEESHTEKVLVGCQFAGRLAMPIDLPIQALLPVR